MSDDHKRIYARILSELDPRDGGSAAGRLHTLLSTLSRALNADNDESVPARAARAIAVWRDAGDMVRTVIARETAADDPDSLVSLAAKALTAVTQAANAANEHYSPAEDRYQLLERIGETREPSLYSLAKDRGAGAELLRSIQKFEKRRTTWHGVDRLVSSTDDSD